LLVVPVRGEPQTAAAMQLHPHQGNSRDVDGDQLRTESVVARVFMASALSVGRG
jgi:hypothetical protein